MIDNKIIGSKPKIEYYKTNGVDMVRIPYEMVELRPGKFAWKELIVKFNNFNYGGIVNALIGIKYSSDAMTAIINNYLLDPNDVDAKSEFNTMQEYRKEAKAIAHSIIDALDK